METMDLVTMRTLLERHYGADKVPSVLSDLLGEWQRFITSGSALDAEQRERITEKLSSTFGPWLARYAPIRWRVGLGG